MHKGFISVLFIAIFFNILWLVSLISSQMVAHLMIVDEMKKVNEDITAEAYLINELNCHLKQSDQSYIFKEEATYPYEAYVYDDEIEVYLLNEGRRLKFIIDTSRKEVVDLVLSP